MIETRVGQWPFTGRDKTLDALRDALDRHGVVVVAGPAGVGKSRLVREVLAGMGGDADLAVATRSARDVPLGALAPWLDLPETPRAEAPTVKHAVDALLARGPHRPLVVDDAHTLDAVSATVLHQVALRGGTRLLLTLRTGVEAPEAVTALWKDGPARRIELGSLDAAGTAALVEAGLGGTVELTTRRRLYAVTRGNALWLRHLVDGETAAGRLVRCGGIWEWIGEPALSPGLDELVAADIGRLSDQQRRIVELLAFGEPLGLDLLHRLGGDREVEELAERALIVVDAEGARRGTRLAHPLYGESIRGRVGRPRARRLCGELAVALDATGARRAGDVLRRAVLGLGSDDFSGAALFVEAAGHAAALNDYALAERLFRAAVARGGGVDARLGLALLLSFTFRAEEAEAEIAAAVRQATTPREIARTAVARASIMYFLVGRSEEAHAALDAAEATLGADPAVADLHGMRATLFAVGGRLAEARASGARALADPAASGLGKVWAAWALVVVAAVTGRNEPLEDVATTAIRHARQAPEAVHLQALVGYVEIAGHLWAGRVGAARRRAEWMRDRPGDQTYRALFDAQLALGTGRLLDAVESLGALRGVFGGRANGWGQVVVLMSARAHAMRGDAARAASELARLAEAEHPGMGVLDPEVDLVRGWVAAAHGATGEASALALRAARAAQDAGQYALEVVIRHTVVCFGSRSQAARLGALASMVGTGRAEAAAAHAAAWEHGDADALEAVSRTLDTAELTPFAADAAAQAATVHREHGRVGAGTAAAARAEELAARCDGARTPAIVAACTPVPVTGREREVATLAATGLTNREIAVRLSVSVRTVESHIYRACTRLGLADRAELAAAVAPGTSGQVQ